MNISATDIVDLSSDHEGHLHEYIIKHGMFAYILIGLLLVCCCLIGLYAHSRYHKAAAAVEKRLSHVVMGTTTHSTNTFSDEPTRNTTNNVSLDSKSPATPPTTSPKVKSYSKRLSAKFEQTLAAIHSKGLMVRSNGTATKSPRSSRLKRSSDPSCSDTPVPKGSVTRSDRTEFDSEELYQVHVTAQGSSTSTSPLSRELQLEIAKEEVRRTKKELELLQSIPSPIRLPSATGFKQHRDSIECARLEIEKEEARRAAAAAKSEKGNSTTTVNISDQWDAELFSE